MTSFKNLKVWNGVYGSFAETEGNQSVFEGDIWLKKCVERAQAALASSRGVTAIPAIAETRDYALPFVAAVLARRDTQLRILDFGGGLGTSYLPLVHMLDPQQQLEVVIVENEKLCRLGRELFSGDTRVRFVAELPIGGRFQIVHCGSSLHYVDDWQVVVRRLVQYAPEYLILVDLPAADNITFVTTQSFHGRRIPVRFWNVNDLVNFFGSLGYELALKARYRSSSFDVSAAAATSHFDSAHRLDYFSQLIFRSRQIP